jgi:RHS repeat-associated protein
VRDAQGNVMSVYTQRDSTSIGAMYFTQTEKHLYGSSRIGIDETQTQLLGLTASADTSHHYAGYKLYELSNHLGSVLTTISDKKVAQNPQSPAIIYSTPDVVRTGIDSLGGMKIQPMSQYAGNHFTFPATVGNNYKVDFYFNLANTNPDSVTGDWPVISYDANNTNGFAYNDLYHTGHYSFILTAPDTLFDLKILYYGASSVPKGYMLVDSLHIVEVGNTKDTILNYVADVRSVSDVSPFGAPMSGRTCVASNYRYGYQGSEKDDEISGGGNTYTTENRALDVRLGRWFSMDAIRNPAESPYVSMGNNPVWYNDIFGTDFGKPGDEKQTKSDKKQAADLKKSFKGRETELQGKLDEVTEQLKNNKLTTGERKELNQKFQEYNTGVHDLQDAQKEMDALENDHSTFYTFKMSYNPDEGGELHPSIEQDKKGNTIYTIPYAWGSQSTGSKAHETKHAFQYFKMKTAPGSIGTSVLSIEKAAYIRQYYADPLHLPVMKDANGNVNSINSYKDINEGFLKTFKKSDGTPVYDVTK